MIDTTPITFDNLSQYDDSTTAVFMAVIFPDDQDWEEVTHFFADELGFSKGRKVIGCHKITGNVLGDKGRSDYLLEFDHAEIPFNPLARLRCPDLKWTSDFIDNYRQDYGYGTN